MVDFCHFSRETVSIAISILDRFMATPQGHAAIINGEEFQLAAMTSLYIAVKIHEPEIMSASLISTLSRGAHTTKNVERMEQKILHAVRWRVNPPTSLSFVRQYIKLLPQEFLDEETKTTLYDVTKFQSELAVADYTFISIPQSSVAYASLMNALESMCLDNTLFGCICSILSQAADIDVRSHALAFVQVKLCEAVTRQAQAGADPLMNNKAINKCAMNIAQSSIRDPHRTSYKASPCTVTRMEC